MNNPIYEQPNDYNQPTMMSLEEFEEYRESVKEIIKKAEAAAKLSQYPEFKSIIMEDYFVEEPKRLGQLMASGQMTPNGFDGAANDLKCIGYLRKYLQEFITKGNIAAEELQSLEEARASDIAQMEGGA